MSAFNGEARAANNEPYCLMAKCFIEFIYKNRILPKQPPYVGYAYINPEHI